MQLVDGIRVITEGPPPVRDVTDPPAIPARFTPSPAKDRALPPLSPLSAESAPDVMAAPPPPAELPVAEVRPEPSPEPDAAIDTLTEGSLDPEWDRRAEATEEEIRVATGLPAWAIGIAAAAAGLVVVAALGLLAALRA